MDTEELKKFDGKTFVVQPLDLTDTFDMLGSRSKGDADGYAVAFRDVIHAGRADEGASKADILKRARVGVFLMGKNNMGSV